MIPIVKICGITTAEAIHAAKDAEYLGFIFFASSPRNIEPAIAARLSAAAPTHKKVAVIVNPDDAFLSSLLSDFTPDYLQLHGEESIERIKDIKQRFKLPIIKAIKVTAAQDIVDAKAYEEAADILLFDAKAPKGLPGGNGIRFDWSLLTGVKFTKPWFVSGGINIDNVKEALHVSGADMVDVSSGVESSPGIKDSTLIKAFIEKVKTIREGR